MFTNSINPILIEAGLINIRWYGLFLAIGVLCSVIIIVKLFKKNNLRPQDALDLCAWLIIGGLVGARLGEILFYEPTYYFSHPLEIIMINHGGLSSHGMTIGLLVTFWVWARKRVNWQTIADILVIPIPLLAAFIRIGNFFNSEILGKPTDLPWGVKFPLTDPSLITRHPIQIYEALIALIIFNIQYLIFKKYFQKLQPLFITNLFLLLYFSSRFILELWKADYQTNYFLTMGQFLSLPFIFWGLYWFVLIKKKSV